MSSTGFARRHALRLVIAAGVLLPATASAQVAQEKIFLDTLNVACNSPANASNTTFLINVCSPLQAGGLAGGANYTSASGAVNVGSAGSYGSAGRAAVAQQAEDITGDDDAKKRGKRGGGGGDFTAGPFGGFVTAQTSKTTRALTDLENGYDAKLKGFTVGLDRRFGNELVTGASLGTSDTDSTYANNAGTMKARNTTLMFYGTYLLSPQTYLGAYLGAGRGTQDAVRNIDFPTAIPAVHEVATSTTKSHQTLAGLSGGYNWYSGALTVSATGAADYVQSKTDATTESGARFFGMTFDAQKITSLTGTLGTRASYRSSFTWGAIVPSIRAAYVHEFKDNARTVTSSLNINPSTQFAFRTDAPDRSYYLSGVGATAEVGRGTQLFVDYEKRSGHRFIETWAASAGVILEF